jgi:hypothetical protein
MMTSYWIEIDTAKRRTMPCCWESSNIINMSFLIKIPNIGDIVRVDPCHHHISTELPKTPCSKTLSVADASQGFCLGHVGRPAEGSGRLPGAQGRHPGFDQTVQTGVFQVAKKNSWSF